MRSARKPVFSAWECRRSQGPPPLPSQPPAATVGDDETAVAGQPSQEGVAIEWREICFYVTPIGEDGTDIRKHADMMLKHLLEPVAKEFKLRVVRADKIGRLPDTTGMPGKVLIQAGHRYHYERAVTVPGARLVQVGEWEIRRRVAALARPAAPSANRDCARCCSGRPN